MELMQLRMLVAVADGKSLQAAAQCVRRTPQAVGMALDKLERELGVEIFQRPMRAGTQLTEAGAVLVDHARRSLALLEKALATIDDFRSGSCGRLHIGANQSIGEHVLPHLAGVFRRKCPDVRIRVSIDYSDVVLAALARRELDIALVANPPHDANLDGALLMNDRVVAVMSPRHRLAGRDQIAIADLARESLILLSAASELHERVVSTFRRLRVPVNTCVETSTLESVKQMVARDVGIGLVPRLSVGQGSRSNGLVVKTIVEFGEDRGLWLAYPHEPAPAAQAFISIMQTECSGQLLPAAMLIEGNGNNHTRAAVLSRDSNVPCAVSTDDACEHQPR